MKNRKSCKSPDEEQPKDQSIMKKRKSCKSPNEEQQIIEILQKENSAYSIDLILQAIDSCCAQQILVNEDDSFLDCVRKRLRMFINSGMI
jgi:hypothetical protein